MKNVSGRIILLLLFSASALATEPTEQPYLSTDNDCGVSMGFMTGHYRVGGIDYGIYTAVVVGTNDSGGYYAKTLISPSGSFSYTNFAVKWVELRLQWEISQGAAYQELTQCQNEFNTWVNGKTPEECQDIPTLHDEYFPPVLPESRLPLDVDLDGNGKLDYYDLESEQYQDYLDYCQEMEVEPLDLVDYMYWYQNDLGDWLSERTDLTDTDGDGFTDGYERIHGTEVYDGSDYPLGIPDTGSSLLVVGGIEEKEPWRLEEYNDSGYSKGHVYDQGYDPFGNETLTFEGDPDWGLMDSDNDGLVNNAELANGTDPYRFEFQSGFSYVYNEDGGYYSVTGYTEDGAFGDYGHAPTKEEYLADDSLYNVGDYAYQPSEFSFGVAEYDSLLNSTDKIKPNFDDVRPAAERDYRLTFSLPFPGGMESFTISVLPDTSTPAGVAMETVRQLVRGFTAVVFSYVFIRHVWLAIRQY